MQFEVQLCRAGALWCFCMSFDIVMRFLNMCIFGCDLCGLGTTTASATSTTINTITATTTTILERRKKCSKKMHQNCFHSSQKNDTESHQSRTGPFPKLTSRLHCVDVNGHYWKQCYFYCHAILHYSRRIRKRTSVNQALLSKHNKSNIVSFCQQA